ncbi:hypothetical protein HDV00_003333 [Rhizophlyctis rosea]|nr:hypothetical protein HDV00_003333 [Rhizophlyctis rosea]
MLTHVVISLHHALWDKGYELFAKDPGRQKALKTLTFKWQTRMPALYVMDKALLRLDLSKITNLAFYGANGSMALKLITDATIPSILKRFALEINLYSGYAPDIDMFNRLLQLLQDTSIMDLELFGAVDEDINLEGKGEGMAGASLESLVFDIVGWDVEFSKQVLATLGTAGSTLKDVTVYTGGEVLKIMEGGGPWQHFEIPKLDYREEVEWESGDELGDEEVEWESGDEWQLSDQDIWGNADRARVNMLPRISSSLGTFVR